MWYQVAWSCEVYPNRESCLVVVRLVGCGRKTGTAYLVRLQTAASILRAPCQAGVPTVSDRAGLLLDFIQLSNLNLALSEPNRLPLNSELLSWLAYEAKHHPQWCADFKSAFWFLSVLSIRRRRRSIA